jgi:predicted nucleic acid-binding protein
MGTAYVLDTTTLIHILAPKASKRAGECLEWFVDERAAGARFYVPSLAYHEALRGAEHQRIKGDPTDLRNLKLLVGSAGVRLLTISNAILDRAARIWAEARANGLTPDDNKLSGDVVIMAEARALRTTAIEKVIVTDNMAHFLNLGASMLRRSTRFRAPRKQPLSGSVACGRRGITVTYPQRRLSPSGFSAPPAAENGLMRVEKGESHVAVIPPSGIRRPEGESRRRWRT